MPGTEIDLNEEMRDGYESQSNFGLGIHLEEYREQQSRTARIEPVRAARRVVVDRHVPHPPHLIVPEAPVNERRPEDHCDGDDGLGGH